jgi:hypothetical protein
MVNTMAAMKVEGRGVQGERWVNANGSPRLPKPGVLSKCPLLGEFACKKPGALKLTAPSRLLGTGGMH